MFSDLSFIDKNFSLDITQEDVMDSEFCHWFTLPVAVYRMVDAESQYNVYEYLSFPVTAKGEQHMRFFSVTQPYHWNHDYADGVAEMFEDGLEG